MGDFPHPLLILYQIRHVMSSFFQSFFSFFIRHFSVTFNMTDKWRKLFNLKTAKRYTESSKRPVRWWLLYFFTFIFFRSWLHLLSSFFQYFLSSSSVSNRSSGCTDFHDTTCWVSSLRVSNLWRLYPHHDPTVSSTCVDCVTVPPLCRYSSTVSFLWFIFTCSWYG